jgi:hypothetical protein
MATQSQNITDWFWGEDRIFEFIVKDDAGVPQDITAWDFKWEMRSSDTDPVVKLAKTVGSGITITDGPNGRLEVRIFKSDTDPAGSGPTPATYRHALARIDNNAWNVLALGNATLSSAAVRP